MTLLDLHKDHGSRQLTKKEAQFGRKLGGAMDETISANGFLE